MKNVRISVVVTASVLALAGSVASGQCIVPDNGNGTATMPPAGCTYFTFDDDMRVIDGLPFGDTIEINARIEQFAAINEVPGGTLGGTRAHCGAVLVLPMQGTGTIAQLNRFIQMPLPNNGGMNFFDCAPRTGGDPSQSFDTEMLQLTGDVAFDPDFNFIRIRAGVQHLLPPSTGHTVIGSLPGNTWQVDSFFDVTYTIEFEGAKGSLLDGFAGTTQGTVRFSTDFCPADLNNDGVIDTADLGILIAEFGTPGVLADINGDGVVDTADLGILISKFGQNCFPV